MLRDRSMQVTLVNCSATTCLIKMSLKSKPVGRAAAAQPREGLSCFMTLARTGSGRRSLPSESQPTYQQTLAKINYLIQHKCWFLCHKTPVCPATSAVQKCTVFCKATNKTDAYWPAFPHNRIHQTRIHQTRGVCKQRLMC